MNVRNKMEKKLYKVVYEVECVVHAKNEEEAIGIARDNVHNEIDNAEIIAADSIEQSDVQMLDGWEDAYPYSETNETVKTCQDIFRELFPLASN